MKIDSRRDGKLDALSIRCLVQSATCGGEGVAKAVRASLGEMWITCQVCKSDLFRERGVKLNSTGGEFFNLAWADETATGLICWRCGFVHLFANPGIQLHRVKE